HPCIVTWVIFNEKWGSYDQKRITEWVKGYDPSRIVNGHSGELLYVNNQLRSPSDSPWISSDVTDIHSYPEPRNVPGQPGKAKVIGEYGGIGVPVPAHQWDDIEGWGYTQVTPAELKGKYENMISIIKKLELAGLSASIYTQPFDVEGEENGILTYDREIIKVPVDELRKINRNLVPQTEGFKIDTNFKIAINLDLNDNDNRYQALLGEYESGSRDSSFLRRLVLMAIRHKDQLKATQVGNAYISTLLNPFSKENLMFIGKITRTTNDIGFKLFNKYPEKINSIVGEVYAEYIVKMIIEHEDLASYFSRNSIFAWDSLQRQMNNKYGVLGEEVILGKRMMHCADVLKDWQAYGKYYMLYFQKAMKHPDYITNNLSWKVFQHVDDPNILRFALKVMEYDLATWDQNEPQAYDTYANLLHKLDKSSEAIKWEEKAIQLKRNEAEEKAFADALQKMKSGLPTWPQNN
ncbi:MAG TPA: glycoside hydrolase family 2, partial [Chitinophaga sp.]